MDLLYIGIGILFFISAIVFLILYLIKRYQKKGLEIILRPIISGSPKTKIELLRLDKEIVKAKTLKNAKTIRSRFVVESEIIGE